MVELPLLASSHQPASKQQAPSMQEMGKTQNSYPHVPIRPKFGCMILMSVKYNHTIFEQETQQWGPGTGVTSGMFSEVVKKFKKTAIVWALGVPHMFVEGTICIETNPDDEQLGCGSVH